MRAAPAWVLGVDGKPLDAVATDNGSWELRDGVAIGALGARIVAREQAEPERLQAALIENMVREDLNPVEEAKACAALVEELGMACERAATAGIVTGVATPLHLLGVGA